MITMRSMQMTTSVCVNAHTEPKHALIQGAPSRLRFATVVPSVLGAAQVSAQVSAQVKGAPVTDAKYGGQGSRAWSPPV